MIPSEQFCRSSHRHQQELFQAFDLAREASDIEPQMFMCEWHRRCRKTTAALNLAIRECCRFGKGKYGFIAPTQVQARNIVVDDPNMLRAYLPEQREMSWKLNEQKMLVTFGNQSLLKIGGSDEPDAWRGTDFLGVVLDEWSLQKESLWTEILRPVIAGPIPPAVKKHQPFRWAMFLYTPVGINHATVMFDKAACVSQTGKLPTLGRAEMMMPNWYASRVDGEASGIFSNAELVRMKTEMTTALYDQEIRCSRVTSEEMVLITSEMIHRLNQHAISTTVTDGVIRSIVSIDPAFGGDVCKMLAIRNGSILKERTIRDKHSTSEIVQAGKVLAAEIGTTNFVVDSIGNGLGVSDGLKNDVAQYHVQAFDSAAKAKQQNSSQYQLQFANRRAEAYWYTAERIRHFDVGQIKSDELMRQLPQASRYQTQAGSGRILIRPKDKIKEDLGCSPDEADCYVMGIWGLQHVQPDGLRNSRQVGAMSVVPSYIGV